MKRAVALLGVITLSLSFVVSAQQTSTPGVRVAPSEELGAYLTDGDGKSLYAFVVADGASDDADPDRMTEGVRQAAASCAADCLEAWPPFVVEGEVTVLAEEDAPAGTPALDPELLYTATVEDRVQVVYNGWPLFYFARDEEPRQVQGQGVEGSGGTWHLVSPDGQLIGGPAPTAGAAEPAAPPPAGEAESPPEGADDAATGEGQPTSVWVGVYTQEQADRGAEQYAQHCESCHAANLRGTPGGPAIAGGRFMLRWTDRNLGELFAFIHAEMPADRPGSLSDATYASILAYILSQNGFPAGDTELQPDAAALEPILIERRAE